MTDSRSLTTLPSLPRDAEGPVFVAPWEAQAFAMTLRLYEHGHFTWTEWAERLATEIRLARERGDPDVGTTYYEHWLAALEKLVADKGLLRIEELTRRKADWEVAARETPPGQPIELRAREGIAARSETPLPTATGRRPSIDQEGGLGVVAPPRVN